MENSISLRISRHTVYLISYVHILATVSAELFGVAFESSEWKELSVADPSVAIVHESEGPNGSADVVDPKEKRDKNLKHYVQPKTHRGLRQTRRTK